MNSTSRTPTFHLVLPLEHGSTVQLCFPLVAALAAGDGRWRAWALALAAALLYLALEPLRVLAGHRGDRIRSKAGATLWPQFALWFLPALGLFAASLLPEGQTPYWTLALPAALSVPSLALLALRAERSLVAEALGAVTLSAWGVPAAVAGGVRWEWALGFWLVFAAGNYAAVHAVNRIIALAKPKAEPVRRAELVPLLCATAVSPVLGATSLALTLRPPDPKMLRTLGWALTAANVATGAGLVTACRLLGPG